VQRSQVSIVVVAALMLVSASMSLAADLKAPARGAVVSGIVRDAQGMALMGAVIQVMANDSVTAATAFTDLHGRYVVANLLPGKYHVRASAALFVPTLRDNLQLHSGARTVVNLTLSTLFESTAWLPAERRQADEPGDDWKWTLRSAANRPILRMVEDGEIMLISSSATESPRVPIDSGKGSVVGGDGTFGRGGVHNTISLDRGFDDGSDVRFRVDLGTGLAQGRAPVAGRPSMEIQTGYQRKLGPGGAARTVVSYQSHPEMVGTGAGSGRSSGLDAAQVATAQKMQFGDAAEIEVGSALNLVHTSGYLASAYPFLRVTAHPSSDWTLGYRMATSRDMQAFNGLDAVRPELRVAVMSRGRLRTERGVHQEVSVARRAGRGTIQASYYRDVLDSILVSGGGGLSSGDLDGESGAVVQPVGVIADAATGGFRLLASGYSTQGINVMLTEPLTTGLWAAVEYANGSALASRSAATATLTGVGSELQARSAQSATIALKGRVLHTGTNVRAAYRWQPAYLVTAVDPYAAFSDQAFFSFFLRQPVNCGHWLPSGLEATVDVTNLLAQGYRPFLSADGRTLYLAQAPRSIQAGLAFNF
jgi:Carboxypeptidase regulatory-like domain